MQAAGATRDFMRDKVAPGMASAGRAAKEKGRKALGAAKDFFSGRMGREADGSAKEGFRGRMSRLAQGIKNTPKALAENRAAKRGRISNEGALRDNQDEIRRLKNTMHGGNAATGKLPGTDEQRAKLDELMGSQGEINEKLNDPNAKMGFRDRVRQIGDRQAQDRAIETPPPAEEEQLPVMPEEAPPAEEEQLPVMPESTPETATPAEDPVIPTPAQAVEGGADKDAVEAAQTDTPMPEAEEDAYANYRGEGHSGEKEFGKEGSTRQKTSRSLVDAMRDYEGKDFGELEAAVRAVPTKRGGKRRLSPYQRRMMEQHAKRRGFGPGAEEELPVIPDSPSEPSEPSEPDEPVIPEAKEEKKPVMPMDMTFSEDPMDSAWDALMILKHR